MVAVSRRECQRESAARRAGPNRGNRPVADARGWRPSILDMAMTPTLLRGTASGGTRCAAPLTREDPCLLLVTVARLASGSWSWVPARDPRGRSTPTTLYACYNAYGQVAVTDVNKCKLAGGGRLVAFNVTGADRGRRAPPARPAPPDRPGRPGRAGPAGPTGCPGHQASIAYGAKSVAPMPRHRRRGSATQVATLSTLRPRQLHYTCPRQGCANDDNTGAVAISRRPVTGRSRWRATLSGRYRRRAWTSRRADEHQHQRRDGDRAGPCAKVTIDELPSGSRRAEGCTLRDAHDLLTTFDGRRRQRLPDRSWCSA